MASDPDTLPVTIPAAPSGPAQVDASFELRDLGATMAGAVMGTPGYMAPEQAAGEVATPASDVWSLAAVLFEVVTLQPLVKGGTSLELMTATHGVLAVRDHAPGLDVAPELEALCNRALAREPHQRPTARQLADGLEAVLSGQRDLALRDQLAVRHAERASSAAAQALRDGADLSARREAGGRPCPRPVG